LEAYSALLVLSCCCAFADERAENKNTARKAERERKQGEADAIELRRINVREEQRQTRHQQKVEDALVKAIQVSEPGSPAQLDLIRQWEKIRAVRAGGDPSTLATQMTAGGARSEGNVGANPGGLRHLYGQTPAEANGTGDVDGQSLPDYSA
jgi:hypothetical protein